MTKSYVLVQSGIAATAVAAAVVAVVVYVVTRSGKGGWRIQPGDDWDFSESWASTATVGTAGLAALFGSSDVVIALKGDKATLAPVIVVASAVALGLVTAAPLVVKAASDSVKGESAVAISVAAWMTVGAALFEGTVIVWLAKDLTELGGWGDWPAKLAWLVTAVLLIAYAYRSLRVLLESPTPDQVAEATKSADQAARRASIALAVAEAQAVAAANARRRLSLRQTHEDGDVPPGADIEQATAARDLAEREDTMAREMADESAEAAASAASRVPARRRAAIL